MTTISELNTVLTDVRQAPIDNLRFSDYGRVILAASPIMKTPATAWYRVVLTLIKEGSKVEFTVHNEIWPSKPLGIGDYDQGDYFPADKFAEAYKRWCDRCLREHPDHVQSMYREIELKKVEQ